MSGIGFLALLFGVPVLALAFAPASFRRFCIVASVPFVVYFLIFPVRGADNPAGIFEIIPQVVLIAALVVEAGAFLKRRMSREVAHGR